jgi:hypothetical protein
MADQTSQPKKEGRRYKTFEEFSLHFYNSTEHRKPGDEPNVSFGIELSRDLVRQNIGKSSKRASGA